MVPRSGQGRGRPCCELCEIGDGGGGIGKGGGIGIGEGGGDIGEGGGIGIGEVGRDMVAKGDTIGTGSPGTVFLESIDSEDGARNEVGDDCAGVTGSGGSDGEASERGTIRGDCADGGGKEGGG